MLSKFQVVAIALMSFFAMQAYANDVYYEPRPILETKNGKLQGVERDGMVMYKNIPYAAPPIGELRWRPPQAAPSWAGVRDASKFGQACLQPLVQGLTNELVPGSEDCLKLNVFAPKGAKGRPVMVWIHGGGLLTGSATEPYYVPVGLIKHDVVVVSLDYRLGRLGFFAPKELVEEARRKGEPFGNYGIMDQIQALQWVGDNIATFGGDPNNVTIFGQSAGGRSVTYLMTSPAAAGLFHRAIAQSPNQLPLRRLTQEHFGQLSVEANDNKFIEAKGNKTISELRNLPVEEVSLTAADFVTGGFDSSMVDGEILVDDPIPLFAEGKQHKVPFMVGTNEWDASLFTVASPTVAGYVEKMKQDPETSAKLYKDFAYKCDLAVAAQMIADGWMTGSVKFLADRANKAAPAYAYFFSFLTPSIKKSYIGSPHMFELPYVFGTLDVVNAPPRNGIAGNPCSNAAKAVADLKERNTWSKYYFVTSDVASQADRLMARQLALSWANFAKTGNPNSNGESIWPRYDIKSDVMRHFNNKGKETITGVNKERVDYQMEFIRRFYGVQ